MKILRIIPSMHPSGGGPCQGIRNSIPALSKLEVENEVVCLDDPAAEFIRNDPFTIHALGKASQPWNYNKTLKHWLTDHLSNYDVVIIHGLWSYPSYITSKIVRQLRRKRNKQVPKTYLMPHGMLDPWFQRDKTRRLKAFRNAVYWQLIEQRVVNAADGLLFTCEEELRLARNTFPGYRPRQELNTGYGIQPPPRYSSSMPSALVDKPYWLFLSRIHPKKGVDLLVDAYRKLETESKDVPDLVIAGPGDSEYAASIQEMAMGSKKIHFTDMLQGDAKWGAFYGCEAFILPSHQENFGIAVVEALACTKPVLISKQVNTWREIAEGKGGLVADDTAEGTYQLLKKWLQLSAEEKQQLSNNARKVYEQHFTIEQAARRMVEVLRS